MREIVFSQSSCRCTDSQPRADISSSTSGPCYSTFLVTITSGRLSLLLRPQEPSLGLERPAQGTGTRWLPRCVRAVRFLSREGPCPTAIPACLSTPRTWVCRSPLCFAMCWPHQSAPELEPKPAPTVPRISVVAFPAKVKNANSFLYLLDSRSGHC
jgi:hypothetical protein